jgi:siroheme synthase (precorrin-2 oxidase/ferrochelatase)
VLEQITAKNGGQLATMLADTLPAALPPEAAEQARRLLEHPEADAARRRVLRDAVQYQSFRQSLTEAFQ